ncbi:hypothetical protein [Bradyrhizobium sp.]|uniref:hypothetical protein n=1 Tax=Bradyrhizobium sp. TaxID=376 RepID=UPI003C52EF09
MSRRLVVIVMFAIAMSSAASAQQSLQELESASQFERALRAVDAIKHGKRLQCIIAIANEAICACLAEKLPVDTYIRSYVALVDQEKTEPEYGRLSDPDKEVVDRCVGEGR